MQRYPQPASGGHTSDREHGGRRFSGGHEGRCIFIVNTARGDLVASAALAKALCSGKIAGAGLDTIAPEPVTTENPLLSLPHDVAETVIYSPHIAGITGTSGRMSYRMIAAAIRAVQSGQRPENIVNGL